MDKVTFSKPLGGSLGPMPISASRPPAGAISENPRDNAGAASTGRRSNSLAQRAPSSQVVLPEMSRLYRWGNTSALTSASGAFAFSVVMLALAIADRRLVRRINLGWLFISLAATWSARWLLRLDIDKRTNDVQHSHQMINELYEQTQLNPASLTAFRHLVVVSTRQVHLQSEELQHLRRSTLILTDARQRQVDLLHEAIAGLQQKKDTLLRAEFFRLRAQVLDDIADTLTDIAEGKEAAAGGAMDLGNLREIVLRIKIFTEEEKLRILSQMDEAYCASIAQ